MLDGASRIGEVVAAAAADGQPAVGITDHGNMYGALPMYEAARNAGVKPVLGMEGYFTNTSRFDRPKRSEHEIFHLTMLAETNAFADSRSGTRGDPPNAAKKSSNSGASSQSMATSRSASIALLDQPRPEGCC